MSKVDELIQRWLPGGPHDTVHIEPQSYAEARRDIPKLASLLKLAMEGLPCSHYVLTSMKLDSLHLTHCIHCRTRAAMEELAEGKPDAS